MNKHLHLTLSLLASATLGACASQPAAERADVAPAAATSTAASAATVPTLDTVPYTAITPQHLLRQPVAADVVELAHSAAQQAVFVSAPDWEDEDRSALLRLHPDTLAVQAEVPLQGKGFGVALDDAANRVYLTQGFNGAISVVDTQHNRLVKRIPVMEKVNFERAYQEKGFSEKRTAFLLEQLKRFKVVDDFPYKLREMVVDPRHERLFAPGLGLGFDSVLFVVNTRTLEVEKVLEGFGYNAVGIALDARNGRVFVSNMRGQVMVVDARTLAITATLEVEADQLLNLVYDEVHNRLFGVDQGVDRDTWRDNHLERTYQHRSAGHRVFVLDADTGKTLANMPAGQVPIGLRFDAQRQRLYVTNRGGVRVDEGKGSLTVYDTAAYQLLQTVELPPHPNSLALDADGTALYVTVKNDGAGKKAGERESVVRIGL